jgi:hypothetical protein
MLDRHGRNYRTDAALLAAAEIFGNAFRHLHIDLVVSVAVHSWRPHTTSLQLKGFHQAPRSPDARASTFISIASCFLASSCGIL